MNIKTVKTSFYIYVFCILAFGVITCNDDLEIRQYKVPKKTEQNKSKIDLVWETPTGWTNKIAGTFRIASFTIHSKFGEADASIVQLGGSGGGVLANINRWRGQIGLEKFSTNELLLLENRDSQSNVKFKWYRLVNAGNESAAILGAVIPQKNTTIFVKIKGPLSTLDENQDKFLELCRSIQKGKK